MTTKMGQLTEKLKEKTSSASLLNLADRALYFGSRASGLLVAMAVVLLRLPGSKDWEWDAFGGTATVAGFMLAALALVEGARKSERMKSLSDTPTMDSLISALVGSMWAWTFASISALAHWYASLWAPAAAQQFFWALFAGFSTFAGVEFIRATWWVSLCFRRYRSDVE